MSNNEKGLVLHDVSHILTLVLLNFNVLKTGNKVLYDI